MKSRLRIFWLIAFLMPVLSVTAFASNYTFDVNLVSTTLDATRSAANTLGFDNWYVWRYRVDVVSGGGEHGHALSHWVLELPDCYIASPNLFQEMEASAGWGGGDRVRVYDPEAVSPDPTTGLYGLKWDHQSGDELDRAGEYDYFWFSAPTNEDIETDWAVKAGQGIIEGEVSGPACPENPPSGHEIPEPATMLLWGAGLVGTALAKRRRK